MEPPHLHAHAVFIELTFGLNSVFSLYKEFYDFLAGRVERKIRELTATADAIESTSPGGSNDRLGNVENQLHAIKGRHLWIHRVLYWPTISLAILCAMAALLILYFDWIEAVSWWCGLLVLPIFFDLSVSGLNFWVFCWRGKSKLNRLARLHDEFDRPLPPPVPPVNGGGPPSGGS